MCSKEKQAVCKSNSKANLANILILIKNVKITLSDLNQTYESFNEFYVELNKLADDDELQKEVKEEIDYIRNKLGDIDKKIHFANNEGIIYNLMVKINKDGTQDLQKLIKEFNDFIFDVRNGANECQEKLAIVRRRVTDFLSNRKNNWIAGTATALVSGLVTSGFGGLGFAAAVITVSNPVTLGVAALVGGAVSVTTMLTGSTIALIHRDTGNKNVEELKDAQVTMQKLQSNLDEAVVKLKDHIHALKSMNAFVADY